MEALDSIDHWWIKYIRFQRLSNGQYFCFTDSADTIIPLYKDKLKAEFVNQDEIIKFMEDKIEIFRSLHKEFLSMLLDDTWLCEEPIELAEVEACWQWAIEVGEEVVPLEDFEKEFKFSLQDLTNWWNKKILELE